MAELVVVVAHLFCSDFMILNYFASSLIVYIFYILYMDEFYPQQIIHLSACVLNYYSLWKLDGMAG